MIAVTIVGVLPLSVFLTVPSVHGLVRFSSHPDLEHFLLARTTCTYQYSAGLGAQFFGASNRLAANPAPATSALDAGGVSTATTVSATPSHSETNNQVSGVDELDTVKTDGQYIYTVSNNTVAIVDAYPVANARLMSRIIVDNRTIDGIFVESNRLSIVSDSRTPYYSGIFCGSGGLATARTFGVARSAATFCYCYWPPQIQNTTISVYDLTDRSSPRLKTTVTVNGTFIGARQIGDYDYLVTSTPALYNQTLPVAVVNGRLVQVQATQIYHSDVSDSAFSYTTVVALNTGQDNPSPTIETYLLGTSSTIYVSLTNIFLTQPIWQNGSGTVIHRISINNSDVKYEATGTVPGHVLNQFSMDEYNGFFRVATSDNWYGGSQNSVYVLSESMQIVGSLEGLSPGEQLYAARFMGDRAYLVTFKRQDPLFVINLGDPVRPLLMGQLNVTGVSDYLQPYDSGHLIGIGKSAQDVAWENAARFYGLKISLFDVTNPNRPMDMSDFTIGSWGTVSPALTDQKALLFDRSLNLLVIPISVYGTAPYSSTPTGYWGESFQGAFVFQLTLQNGIVFRGSITHFPTGSPSGFSTDYSVTRALYIGGLLYTISNAMIKVSSLTDLTELGAINLE